MKNYERVPVSFAVEGIVDQAVVVKLFEASGVVSGTSCDSVRSSPMVPEPGTCRLFQLGARVRAMRDVRTAGNVVVGLQFVARRVRDSR